MLSWLFDWLAEQWLKRCRHNPDHVAADALEGAVVGMQLQRCQRCGATRFVYGDPFTGGAEPLRLGEWNRGRPMWTRDER